MKAKSVWKAKVKVLHVGERIAQEVEVNLCDWDDLRKIIGCKMIEVVPALNGDTMYVDEEGFVKNEPQVNELASYAAGLTIAGHAVVASTADVEASLKQWDWGA